MIKRINHIGMIIKNSDETLQLYVNILGFNSSVISTLKENGVITVMVSLGEATLEAMEPIDSLRRYSKIL